MLFRALGNKSNAAAPNAVRPRGISAESKSRIAILMSRKDDPQVRAMPMDRSQSREVNDDCVSAVLLGFMTGTSLASSAQAIAHIGVSEYE